MARIPSYFYLFYKILHVIGTSLHVELNIANLFALCMYFQGYGSDGLKLLSHEESVKEVTESFQLAKGRVLI